MTDDLVNSSPEDADRIVDPQEVDWAEKKAENSLRPNRFADYPGQDKVKENLQIFIQAAKLRKESLDHVLLHGPPGLGKTTLANIIAHDLGVNMQTTSGPAIDKPGDLAAILTNLEPYDVLFIDEIHRLSSVVEEVLYPAMEDFQLDITIGQGPSARIVRIDLAPFTLIGATTKTGNLTSPMRDRFGIVSRLEFYEFDDLSTIILRSASILGAKLTKEGAFEIAKRSRGTPRIANRLLKRIRDFAQVANKEIIDRNVAHQSLGKLEVDEEGLDFMDRAILKSIIDKYSGGPVGLESIATSVGEVKETIEEVYEPFLVYRNFVNRTPRGRVATRSAYAHLGYDPPASTETQLKMTFPQ